MQNLARAAAVASLACTLVVPTAPIAAPIGSGFGYSEGVVLDEVAWRGGHGKRRGGSHHGNWGGGSGKHWSGGNHGGRHWGGGRKHGGGHWGNGNHGGGKHGGRGHGGHHNGGHHNNGNWDGPFFGFGFGFGSDYFDDDYYFYPAYAYDHEERCAAAYPSYDSDLDAYLGSDGRWYRCTL